MNCHSMSGVLTPFVANMCKRDVNIKRKYIGFNPLRITFVLIFVKGISRRVKIVKNKKDAGVLARKTETM